MPSVVLYTIGSDGTGKNLEESLGQSRTQTKCERGRNRKTATHKRNIPRPQMLEASSCPLHDVDAA